MESLGVEVGKPKLNLEKMMAHKDAVVKSNVEGVAFLFKKNKIDSFIGTGKVLGEGKVSVTGEDGKTQELEAKNIVIATGSDVAGIPGVKVEIDEKVIVSSTGALALDKVPGHLVVVGGGVIGLELGSVWGGSAPRSPWSSISTRSSAAWTARSPSSSSACWPSRAWSSSSAPR
jgi:dihydrolipoamide dehydrogenase